MGLDSGSLIKKLNKTCLDALQGAAGLCLSRTNPSVEIEHWLLKLAEAPNTDLTGSSAHYEIDPSRVQRDLVAAIDRFKTGNSRTPDALDPDRPPDPRGLGARLGPVQASQVRSGMSSWPSWRTRRSAARRGTPRRSWRSSRPRRSGKTC